MDFFTLCRNLRIEFPKPQKLTVLTTFILENSKELSPEEVGEATSSLSKFWRKQGWLLDKTYAIMLDSDEDALLHEKGITIIKTPDDLPPDQICLKFIPLGKSDERVVWF